MLKKINAPASRLKKSCRGVKRIVFSLDNIIAGVRVWPLKAEAFRALCGGGLNSKAAWVRSGCQFGTDPLTQR